MKTDEFELPEGLMEGFMLDDGAGPALPISQFEVERLVQKTMAHAAPPPRSKVPWLAAAALVLFVLPTGVWAAVQVTNRLFGPGQAPKSRPHVPKKRTAPTPAPRLSPQPEDEPDLAKAEPVAPVGRLEVKKEVSLRASEPKKKPKQRTPHRVRSQPLARITPQAAPAQASLQKAGELRRKGAWQKAAEMYAQLRRASEPVTAHVAAVAEGQLRLEHLHDYSGALRAFRAAQSVVEKGPLLAEARLGEGETHLAQGNYEAATRILNTVLRLHPSTNAAKIAEKRLRSIDP